jgi:hypothetical protein
VISEQNGSQNEVDKPRRKRINRKIIFVLLIIALGITAVLFIWIHEINKLPTSSEILVMAKLAQPSELSKDLKVEIRPAMVDNRVIPRHCWLFIRFQMEPNEIRNYLSNSPGIDMNTYRPLSVASYSEENPPWWQINPSAPGRIYKLTEQKNIMTGAVAVDDDTNTVLIFVWYGVESQNQMDVVEELIEDVWHEVTDVF